MKNKIEDYLPFYLGCDCEHDFWNDSEDDMPGIGNGRKISELDLHILEESKWFKPKLILRPLSSMTEEDGLYLARLVAVYDEFKNVAVFRNYNDDLIVEWPGDAFNCTGEKCWSAEQFKFLLTCGYDLFGLIESGLAIDKTKQD